MPHSTRPDGWMGHFKRPAPILPQNHADTSPLSKIRTHHGSLYILDQFRDKVPKSIQHDVVTMLSEFVGTFMYMLTALGCTNVVSASQPGEEKSDLADPAKLQFIALGWGMSIAVNAWVFYRISGSLFNPAVTLAMLLIRAVDPVRGILIVFGQIAGSIAASAVILGLLPNGTAAGTELGGGTSVLQGLFIEMFLTAQIVFAIFMLAAEKHRATYIAPVGIGLAVFICVMMGAYYTGAGTNPARSFGPCVIQGKFPSYHWIYWVGPALGSILATAFYLLVRKLEYWTVSPQQDSDAGMIGDLIVGDDRKGDFRNDDHDEGLTFTGGADNNRRPHGSHQREPSSNEPKPAEPSRNDSGTAE